MNINDIKRKVPVVAGKQTAVIAGFSYSASTDQLSVDFIFENFSRLETTYKYNKEKISALEIFLNNLGAQLNVAATVSNKDMLKACRADKTVINVEVKTLINSYGKDYLVVNIL